MLESVRLNFLSAASVLTTSPHTPTPSIYLLFSLDVAVVVSLYWFSHRFFHRDHIIMADVIISLKIPLCFLGDNPTQFL